MTPLLALLAQTAPVVPIPVVAPGGWTPENVMMVMGFFALTMIPSIIALVKAFRNDGKTEALQVSSTTHSNDIRSLNEQVTKVASATPTPETTLALTQAADRITKAADTLNGH